MSKDILALPTGGAARVSGPDAGPAVICVNGGRAAEVPGTWSSSVEWLVRRLAPAFPELRFAEVCYRVKSWRRFDDCVADCRAALAAVGAERALLLGFSMGGAVGVSCAADPSVEGVLGLAPWLPDRLSVEPLRGKRLRVVHGSLDRALPGVPGVSPALSRRGFERALSAGATGEYTLIACGLHALAVRAPKGRMLPLPRSTRWAELAGEELARFADS